MPDSPWEKLTNLRMSTEPRARVQGAWSQKFKLEEREPSEQPDDLAPESVGRSSRRIDTSRQARDQRHTGGEVDKLVQVEDRALVPSGSPRHVGET